MIARIESKKYIINTYISYLIICKVCYRYKPCTFILLQIEKNLKISLHYIVWSLD